MILFVAIIEWYYFGNRNERAVTDPVGRGLFSLVATPFSRSVGVTEYSRASVKRGAGIGCRASLSCHLVKSPARLGLLLLTWSREKVKVQRIL
mmetsp:Transcript_3768/g.10128  ORF Transcript_3768/g.10128 Transcript_3768/m.10128 type:complete len:93 (-) Transcript_3768:30-308(-)